MMNYIKTEYNEIYIDDQNMFWYRTPYGDLIGPFKSKDEAYEEFLIFVSNWKEKF